MKLENKKQEMEGKREMRESGNARAVGEMGRLRRKNSGLF